jgi:adenine phosphoribosyltransferase
MNNTYVTQVGSQTLTLPVVDLSEALTIALLITVDHGVSFARIAGEELAMQLSDLKIDIIVSVATMGIPLAIETTRALNLDDYVILHKTQKIHLADGEWETVKSITTDANQRLLFDRARIAAVKGKRVAIVDDVISTGGSIVAALKLVRKVGGEPVALGCLVTEGSAWKASLGEDAELVHSLGSIPLFHREGDGSLIEDWG